MGANRLVIERLHENIVAHARNPAFYTDYAVADTFQGRFELLTLLAALVLKRFNEAEAPGPEVAQDLVDAIFRRLDSGLREMGVGDLTVPKRMKTLAGAFTGRCAAYDAGLRDGTPALAAALSRNVYEGGGDGRRLARYAEAAFTGLAAVSLDDCLRAGLSFPDPILVS